jgi:hypothetical protein
MSSTPDQAPKPTGVERTFACEECGGISFKTSEELRKHDREVHQINNLRTRFLLGSQLMYI